MIRRKRTPTAEFTWHGPGGQMVTAPSVEGLLAVVRGLGALELRVRPVETYRTEDGELFVAPHDRCVSTDPCVSARRAELTQIVRDMKARGADKAPRRSHADAKRAAHL